MPSGRRDLLRALLTSSHITARAWLQTLALATEKTRAANEASYLLQVLHAAPIELQQTEREQLYRALHEVLHLLAQRSRREALLDLASLEPTLRVLGGEEATISIACATLEIGCWWP